MSEERSCAYCGTFLSPDAVDGAICEACAQEAVGAEQAAAVVGEMVHTPTPGSGPLPRESAPTVQTVGDFEIIDKLGQGGMGAVYRARQVSLHRLVALKILPSQFEEDENYVARFQREATVAAGLNHPNLVRVFASGQADGCYYIAMELVEGENLRQYLRRHGTLAPLEALRICLGVARGLQCGWQKAQLIHRDIKPSNIYLSAEGEVKLGDLGLAKSLLSNTTGVTHTGTAIGTPHYISPEQARGEKTLDLRADIYSLGCTLFELLTGATPYKGSDPMTVMGMHIHSPPPAILKVMPECPVPLGRIVNKMLRKARHERHQNYEELIAAMESAIEQIENPAAATGPSAVVAAWKEIGAAEQEFRVARGFADPDKAAASAAGGAGKKGIGLWLGLGAAVILAGGLAFFFTRPEKETAAQIALRKAQVAAVAPTPVSSLPQWVPQTEAFTQLSKIAVDANGWLHQTRGSYLRAPNVEGHDMGLRIRFQGVQIGPDLMLREHKYSPGDDDGKTTAVQFRVRGSEISIVRLSEEENRIIDLARAPLEKPLLPGENTFECWAIGQTLIGRINGQTLITSIDKEPAELGKGVAFFLMHKIPTRQPEVINLDGLSEADALKLAGVEVSPASATKDTPFANTLGMKFVPVPITGGPTDGQRVLFSVWDTRVQDCEVFVKETRREWLQEEPTHPAVAVSWEAATAFCQWLTAREQAAGRLPAGWSYRLPSDHEWSCAAGIGGREDAAKLPSENHNRISGAYTWGSTWPPPESAGNYWSEELRVVQAAGKSTWVTGELPGRRDGFANTSPVGSFPANSFGLYDLGGNVWQWCEDWGDKDQLRHVKRGGSWADNDELLLRASSRSSGAPSFRNDSTGFRCVLGASTPSRGPASP